MVIKYLLHTPKIPSFEELPMPSKFQMLSVATRSTLSTDLSQSLALNNKSDEKIMPGTHTNWTPAPVTQ